MPHIFISYSKKDTRPLAFALADTLNALPGVSAWVDRSLKAGAAWETQIQTEIFKCDVFCVLYSPDINRHLNGADESYVLTEIRYAKYTLKKPIIPVMAQKTDEPMTLTGIQYIDYTIPDLSVADLVEALCAEIGVPMPDQNSLSQEKPASLPTSVKSAASPPTPLPRARGANAPATSPPLRPERGSGGEAVPRPGSVDLLPAPFEWVNIPAGKVTLEAGGYVPKGGKTYDVPAFALAKYPVTNAQYRLFVEAGGYRDRQWWTEAGWEANVQGWAWDSFQAKRVATNKAWMQPRYWDDSKSNGAEYPVVGVSWYEAIAFCRWLSAALTPASSSSGRGAILVTLPTEQQWQRAAQGDDGRTYPWGNKWDKTKCNSNESKIGRTTLVTQYPGGASPFGVMDIVGNAWEWCSTDYVQGVHDINIKAEYRVLRGGSWVLNRDLARAVYRSYGDFPVERSSSIGFRVAVSSPS